MIKAQDKYGCLTVLDEGEEYTQLSGIEKKLEIHYKCRCKCGKIHYYNAETLNSKLKYCFYPVPISTNQNATYLKKQKILVYDLFL